MVFVLILAQASNGNRIKSPNNFQPSTNTANVKNADNTAKCPLTLVNILTAPITNNPAIRANVPICKIPGA